MAISVLKQGAALFATLPSEVTDAELAQLQDEIVGKVGQFGSRGVVIDVTALDVLDSFATRTLRAIAHMAQLRGARTIIAGIQPEVAFAMVQLGLTLDGVATTLDLEDGIAMLTGRSVGE